MIGHLLGLLGSGAPGAQGMGLGLLDLIGPRSAQAADNRKIVGTLKSTGRPMLQNDDGSVSTEESITIQDPRLNGGYFTNIPSIWGGQRLSDQDAIEAAIQSGQRFNGYRTMDLAIAAAKARTKKLGVEVDRMRR